MILEILGLGVAIECGVLGARVEVAVSPDDPKNAQLLEWNGVATTIRVMAVLGTGLVLLGAFGVPD